MEYQEIGLGLSTTSTIPSKRQNMEMDDCSIISATTEGSMSPMLFSVIPRFEPEVNKEIACQALHYFSSDVSPVIPMQCQPPQDASDDLRSSGNIHNGIEAISCERVKQSSELESEEFSQSTHIECQQIPSCSTGKLKTEATKPVMSQKSDDTPSVSKKHKDMIGEVADVSNPADKTIGPDLGGTNKLVHKKPSVRDEGESGSTRPVSLTPDWLKGLEPGGQHLQTERMDRITCRESLENPNSTCTPEKFPLLSNVLKDIIPDSFSNNDNSKKIVSERERACLKSADDLGIGDPHNLHSHVMVQEINEELQASQQLLECENIGQNKENESFESSDTIPPSAASTQHSVCHPLPVDSLLINTNRIDIDIAQREKSSYSDKEEGANPMGKHQQTYEQAADDNASISSSLVLHCDDEHIEAMSPLAGKGLYQNKKSRNGNHHVGKHLNPIPKPCKPKSKKSANHNFVTESFTNLNTINLKNSITDDLAEDEIMDTNREKQGKKRISVLDYHSIAPSSVSVHSQLDISMASQPQASKLSVSDFPLSQPLNSSQESRVTRQDLALLVHEKETESLKLLIKAYSKLFTKLESGPCPGAEQQLEKFERILDKLGTCQEKEQVKLKARSGRNHALKTFQARAARLQQRRELMKQAELMHRQLKKRLSEFGYKVGNVENFQQLPHRHNLMNPYEASQISTEQDIDKQPVNEPVSESFVAPDNRGGNQTMKHFKENIMELESDVKSQNHVQKYSPKSFQSQNIVKQKIDSSIGTVVVDATSPTLEAFSLNEKQDNFHKSKVPATVLSHKKSKSAFNPPSTVIGFCPATVPENQTQTRTVNASFVSAEQTGLVRGEIEQAGYGRAFKNSGLRALLGTEGRVRSLIQMGKDEGNGVTVNDEPVFQETTCSQQMDVVYTNDALSNARVGRNKIILPNSHETESRVNVNSTPLALCNTQSIPTNGFVPNTTLDLTTTNSQRQKKTEIAADSNTAFLSKNSEIMQSQMVRQHNQQNLPTPANFCSKASINTCSKPLMINFSNNPCQQNYYTIVDTGGGQLSLVPVSQDTMLKQHMNSSGANEYPNDISENHLLPREANPSFTRKPNVSSSPYVFNTASAQECFSNSDYGKQLGKLKPAQAEVEQSICGKVDVVTVAAGANNGLGEAMSVTRVHGATATTSVELFKTSNINGFDSGRSSMYVQNSSSWKSRPQDDNIMTTSTFHSEIFEQGGTATAVAPPPPALTTATVSECLNPNYIRPHVPQSQYGLNRPILTSYSTAVNPSRLLEPSNQLNNQRILSAYTASQLQHSQHLAIAEQTTRTCIPSQNMTLNFEAAMVGNDAPNGIITRDVGSQFNLCTTTEDLYCQPSGSQVRQNPIPSRNNFTQTSKNGSRIMEACNQKHQASQAMCLNSNSHCNVSSQSVKKSKSSTFAQTSSKPEQKPKGRGRKRKKAANSYENNQGHIVDYFAKLAVPSVTELVSSATTTLVSSNVAPVRLAQCKIPCHASESSLTRHMVKANLGTSVGYKNKQHVDPTENPQPMLAHYPVTLGFEPSSCTTKANIERATTPADIAMPEMLASKTHGNPSSLNQKGITMSQVGTVLKERFNSYEDSLPNCNDTIANNKFVLETAPDLSKCTKMKKLKTVRLIDDAEWFSGTSEFKDFWSESFSQIRMTEDFWQTVDMW